MKTKKGLLMISGLSMIVSFIFAGCQSNEFITTEIVSITDDEVKTEKPEPTASTPTIEQTSTPELIISTSDPSIAWTDDFEDEDLDGWEVWYQGNFIIDDGVLSSRAEGDIYHLSDVLFGTWSFDLYIDSTQGLLKEVQFTEGGTNYQMISIRNSPNTQIWISTQMDPNEPLSSSIDLGKILSGWHHFDVTKDESRWIKVYMDGQFQVEHFDDSAFDVNSLVVYTCCRGPILDNLIVRDQVIEFSSEE